ncbi:MAG: UvrD-helicase domain-containing protein [Planctomycetaceae bacterium]
MLQDIRVTDSTLKPGDLLGTISKWKSAGLAPERASEQIEDDRELVASMGLPPLSAETPFDGSCRLRRSAAADRAVVPPVSGCAARHQQRFQHVQIDEYQDTNGIQFRLIEALVREHRNLCVVGDDDQSIYGWRGAEVSHILGFARQFPGRR